MPVVERSESSSDLRGVTKHLIMIVVATVTMVAIFTAILLSIDKTTDSGAAPSPSSRSIFEGAASASPVASESAIAGSGSGSGGQSASGRTVAVFLGDSYTSGMGGSVDSGGFPALVGQRMGWAVWNIGRPGTGYLATSSSTSCGGTVCPAYSGMISLAKTYSPDVVVVSGGRNDLLAHEDSAIAAAVGEFFTTLRAQLPEARIIVTSPLWDDDAEPARLVALAGVIKTKAEVAGAEYLDLGQPLAGHSELVTADGVHPNDDGYAAVSEAIVEQLAP